MSADSSANEPQDSAVAEVCYRHPDRPTGVTCQRCDRLVCGQCAQQASVGVHCPECTRSNKQKVYTSRTLPGSDVLVTKVLMGLNIVAFVVSLGFGATIQGAGGSFAAELGTWGPGIAENNEFWRIVTGGFGHFGIFHLGVNMFSLWVLGRQLEQALGPKLFTTGYLVSLLGGSFGALLLSPNALTMGASGAIFGLFGLIVFALRARGIGIMQSGLAGILAINFLFSFRGNVSLGGHLGGFLAGAVLGIIFFGLNPGDGPLFGRDRTKPVVAALALGVVFVVGSVLAAMTWMSPLFG